MSFAQLNQLRRVFRCWHEADLRRLLRSGQLLTQNGHSARANYPALRPRTRWKPSLHDPYHYRGGDAHAQTAKQGYPMSGIVCSEIASNKERETYPIVFFEDLALDIPVKGRGEGLACDAQEPSSFRPEVVIAAFDKAIDAAAEGTRLLQGEMIGIAQRNVNAILNQLRKLAGAKSLGEILDLQAAYCRNQLGAFIRQVEEIQAVSTEVANGLAKPIETHGSSGSMTSAR